MVNCQAYGCNNSSRTEGPGHGKTYFLISNPNRFPEKRDHAARWRHNIGTGWTVKTFKFGTSKKVCQDHLFISVHLISKRTCRLDS